MPSLIRPRAVTAPSGGGGGGGGDPAGVTFAAVPQYRSGSTFGATSYFPTGVWLESVLTSSDRTSDEGAGINLYVGLTTDSSLSIATANGARALVQWCTTGTNIDEWANRNTTGADGWVLYDEMDMFGTSYSADAAFLNNVTATLSGRGDTREHYLNWGKGVLFWNPDNEAAGYVNSWGDVISADAYWYTDPNISGPGEGGALLNGGAAMTNAQTRLACNYGLVMDELLRLDTLSGSPRKPLWQFVEVGRPWSESPAQNSPTMLPEWIKGAVWHSIIAGALGIVYFNHSFSADGSYPVSFHCLREAAYAPQRAAVAEVNGRLHDLSQVIHSDTALGYVSTPATVRTLVKRFGGYWYIFAGSANGSVGSRTFTVAGGSGGSVEVLYESRSLSLSGGQFTDTFSAEWETHIYRIPV